jgi:glycosyltransferase involved in cell wall biosynthesis
MAISTLSQDDRRQADRRGLSISAVLPAYNEEALIERSVRRVADVLRQLVGDFEVVVTNDGSHDHTGEFLARLQAIAPDLHLRVVTHPQNRGYGAALTPGGLGVTEPGIVLVLTSLGVGAAGASASALLNRLVNYASLAVAAGAVAVLPRPRGTPLPTLSVA